jgi:hypothetical protein
VLSVVVIKLTSIIFVGDIQKKSSYQDSVPIPVNSYVKEGRFLDDSVVAKDILIITIFFHNKTFHKLDSKKIQKNNHNKHNVIEWWWSNKI